MRSRAFEIIRKPDAEPSFLFNNVEVRYVGTCPETGISFYCSTVYNYGVKVYPNGQKVLINACVRKSTHGHGNAPYLQFWDGFGKHKHIYTSHAVWMAAGRTIPEGMTIDHINGVTTDNRLENLRCLTPAENIRDGGFLTKLRNKGIKPANISRTYLLRYYARMAIIKEALTKWKYDQLDRDDLWAIVCFDTDTLEKYLFNEFKYTLHNQHYTINNPQL